MVAKAFVHRGIGSIPLKQLWAFENVYRYRCISRAAVDLNITTSAVSHRISNLEETLGFSLFTRGRSGVIPTARAIELAQWLGPALSQLSAAGRAVRSSEASSLAVQVGTGVPIEFLFSRLPEFLNGLSCNIQLRWMAQRDTKAFNRTEADVLISYSTDFERELNGARGTDELVLLRAPHYAEPESGLTLLLEPERWESRWRSTSGVNLLVSSRFLFDDPSAMLDACLQGVGVCVAPQSLAASHIAAGALIAAHPVSIPRHAWAARLTKQGRHKAVAKEFLEWVQSVMTTEASGATFAEPSPTAQVP